MISSNISMVDSYFLCRADIFLMSLDVGRMEALFLVDSSRMYLLFFILYSHSHGIFWRQKSKK